MNDLSFAAILVQVLFIDLVLAGDNAIIIGLAVAGLGAEQRRTAILVGVIGATVVRVLFALVAVKLLAIVGLTLAGGILLLWVVWKSAREFSAFGKADGNHFPVPVSMGSAIRRIIVADVSMSLDNVLAVAGAARNHPVLLGFGLVLSIGLMGVAANFVARLMKRFPWIGWIGIGIVFFISVRMIWGGWHQVAPYLPLKIF
ncbi:MAG: TerC family protein [Rhodospirillales bacterium]|nr:TerC family protein [Rhodospirillales bacterium]